MFPTRHMGNSNPRRPGGSFSLRLPPPRGQTFDRAAESVRAPISYAAATPGPILRYPHQPLTSRIWELRDDLTAYDAAYVALAGALDAPLLTRDARLAESPVHTARVELV